MPTVVEEVLQHQFAKPKSTAAPRVALASCFFNHFRRGSKDWSSNSFVYVQRATFPGPGVCSPRLRMTTVHTGSQ